MSATEMLFTFLGGLALFLFGIKSMSDGLQLVAGDKLRKFLEKGTKTPIRGVITGTIVTGIIQSSSGTTVLTVGLVNAGLLTLRQAIGIIMGANIGTTFTAYLIGFELSDYSFPIIAAGVFMLFFLKNKRMKHIGQIFLGFGLLFYGMEVMGEGVRPLRTSPFFIDLMVGVENNPLLGVLIGTVFTAIVQSSTATIGILQELAAQGLVSYTQAVPILFGDNIGTTVTALLAGIGASVAARRAAMTHFMFNTIGTAIFLPLFLLGVFPEMVRGVTNLMYTVLPGVEGSWETLNIKLQIAQTHGVFNFTNTLLHLPFVGLLAALVSKIIPGEDRTVDMKPKYLETRFFGNPAVAMANASRETLRMGKIASDAYHNAYQYFFTRKEEYKTSARQLEEATDQLEIEITRYVLRASEMKDLTPIAAKQQYTVLQAIGDLERVGDHSENLIELTDYAIENKVKFSEEALEDLRQMMDKVQEVLAMSLEALRTGDRELAHRVVESDDVIDQMEKQLRKMHIKRLNEGTCSGSAGAVYLDILSNLERIGDHAVNIAGYALE